MLTWDAVCNQRISKRYGENGFDGGGASVSTGQRMLLIYLLIDWSSFTLNAGDREKNGQQHEEEQFACS